MKLLLVALLIVSVTGCKNMPEARGNAAYTVRCPVILEDGTAATYVDEAGVVLPVMSEFVVTSGRNLSGGVKIDIPGCVKIDIPKLEQGEDRSTSLVGGLTAIVVSIIRVFGG